MRLITISVSHYCEKARWGLERLELPYREDRYPPALHILACLRAGGNRTAPVLVDGARVVPSSSEILAYLDQRADPERRLYPSDPTALAEVRRLEARFDDDLGPHVRRYAYAFLLGLPLADQLLLDGVSPGRARAYRWSRRLIHGLMRKGMRIDAAGAERSRLKCWEVWEEVGALLADGRRYLTGERFTAADLALAALGAPLVAPPEGYGVALPPPDALPPALASESRRAAEHPTGQFILRLYREDRPRARRG